MTEGAAEAAMLETSGAIEAQPLHAGAAEETADMGRRASDQRAFANGTNRAVVVGLGLLCVAAVALALTAMRSPASPPGDKFSSDVTGLQAAPGNWMTIVTSVGTIQITFESQAPQTVAKMKQIIGKGLYNNKVFYRAEPGFVVQGGLRDASGTTTANPYGTFPLEAVVKNTRGTVAMARTNDPNSGNGEFFINLADSTNLDAGAMGPGYTVFGHVVTGMEVAESISKMPTMDQGGIHILNAPVVINSITVQ
jgi:peptidyl-prolyl cis-trans isomerase A (cyclophilin A)